jgi:hypothetical protein
MVAKVVVYDPDGVLSSSFASDAGLGDVLTRITRVSEAQRLSRDAAVLVLVAGRAIAASLGFLAAVGDARHGALVLVASDARRQRRVIIRAARHGAVLMIGQPPSVIGARLRELLDPQPPPSPTSGPSRQTESARDDPPPRAWSAILLRALDMMRGSLRLIRRPLRHWSVVERWPPTVSGEHSVRSLFGHRG